MRIEIPQAATVTVLSGPAEAETVRVIGLSAEEIVLLTPRAVGRKAPLKVSLAGYLVLCEALEEEIVPEGVQVRATISHLLDLEAVPAHSRFWG